MDKDSLGDRMKGYENIERRYLTGRTPALIRLDGKAFHTFTKGFERPFDEILIKTMQETTRYLCENIMGCKIGYTQSDEIQLLLIDYDKLETQAWFDKNIQKMVSVSASMATLAFNKYFKDLAREYYSIPVSIDFMPDEKQKFYTDRYNKYCSKFDMALFDSRTYNLPKEEVCNAFIWRQQDATRNAIQMVGQSNFSFKQLQNKSCPEIQEMLFQEKGINFNDLPEYQKRGSCIIKEEYFYGNSVRTRWIVDEKIPIFTQNRFYIEKYLEPKAE